jgi:UDP-GlcNAc:undecaprenyl-phosphate/decaprenyl-phosphate GlcNAc-1-phosphate transferase
MIETLVIALIAALAAGLVTDLTVPLIERVANLTQALDHPGERKHQARAIPRLGGVAIAGGVAFGAAGVALARWVELSSTVSRSEVIALIMGGIIIFLVGVVDDVVGVSTVKKFGAQILAAMLLVHVGWSFQALSLPGGESIDLGMLGPVLTVLWIVGVTNAVNLLDGLDGLASGVVAIIAASLLGYSLLLGNPGTVILMAAMTGACIGFLRHNWAPAKIFMGDSGSLTLGFLLAAMTVHSSLKAPAAIAILVPLLALGVPVMDTLLVMGVRFVSRPHGPVGDRLLAMFRADRNHVHHLLLSHSKSRGRVVGWIYGTVLVFCGLALVVALTRNPLLGVVVLGIEGGVLVLLRQTDFRRRLTDLARRRRRELKTEMGWEGDDTGAGQPQVVPFPELPRRSEAR